MDQIIMKKKIPLLLLTAIIFVLGSFITTERDTKLIYWDQRKLTWEDFKGGTPGNTPYVALTHSAISLNMSGQDKNIYCSVESVFYPKQSWKKKNVTDHVLNHEQRHFDITEIHSRMLRKTISETRFKKYESIAADIQKLFNTSSTACSKMQDLYDQETDHSKKKPEQEMWNTKIDSLLNVYSDWTQTEFVLDVGYLLE
ncbi:MAG: DUF922 domain-containing protein [Crocinitomicaceae bacterium]|nr:DUF922 domain-containing protein [Crocinitomicaceae bacterium]